MGIAALYDLDRPCAGSGGECGQLRPLVSAVGEDALDERKAASGLSQHPTGSIAILHAGRMHHDAQQQTEGIDEDVPLAAGDLLARIEALRVEPSAPF